MSIDELAVRHFPIRAQRLHALPPGEVDHHRDAGKLALRLVPLVLFPLLIIALLLSSWPVMLTGALNMVLAVGLLLAVYKWPRQWSQHRFAYRTKEAIYRLEGIFDER